MILRFHKVAKRYAGVLRRRTVFSDLNFHLNQGEIVGVVGPNGSGKTTLLKLALGFLHPESGTITILGSSPHDAKVRGRLGWVPDEPILRTDLTARAHIVDWLRAHSRSKASAEETAEKLLATFGLGGEGNSILRRYSRGMLQKASIALAISHDPRLLFLDEPFNALDVTAIETLRIQLVEYVSRGGTVLLASHRIADLGRLCHRLLRIHHGKLESHEAPRTTERKHYLIEVSDGLAASNVLAAEGRDLRWTVEGDSVVLEVSEQLVFNRVLQMFLSRGVEITRLTKIRNRGAEQSWV